MEEITDSLNTGWAEMYMESRRYTGYPTNMIHKTQINITSPNLGRPRCNKTRKQILARMVGKQILARMERKPIYNPAFRQYKEGIGIPSLHLY